LTKLYLLHKRGPKTICKYINHTMNNYKSTNRTETYSSVVLHK